MDQYKSRQIVKPTLLFAVLLIGGWLVSEFLYLDLFGIGRLKAKRQLPGVMREMGFKQTGTGKSGLIPRYAGTCSGYEVKVDSESALITVYMNPIPKLSLSTYDKAIQFDTGNQVVDKYFKERKASTDISTQIVKSKDFLERMEAFLVNRRKICRFIVIQYDMIECGMKFGNGHYIPASIFKPVTTDLVGLAHSLQQSVDMKKKKVENAKE